MGGCLMNRILKKFLQRGVDLSPVGVELREDNTNYFCTPKGASVFGWAGIDGIHFCFIRGFGEMVFSVSPMNTSPDYVHPVAENFTDFLRLILACGDVAAVEQAWMWNEAQFEAFLNENPTTQEQQQTLSEISEKMNLLPMEQPWTYIKNLQSSFDYSQIKYTEDYYDNDMTSEAELVAPEWKVYFDGDFWGHRGKDRAGKEIKLDKQFDWAGYHWVIPAAYSCSKGLVVDFCMRVDSESIRDFMKKWNLDWENDSCENFTREQQMQMEWENPLCFNFKPCLKLNEKILQTTHGCAVSFNPCLPDGVINELEAKWAIDHYGLDSTYGWGICRDVFPWGTKHHPEINKLFLTMEQQPGQVPGSHFKVHAPGDSFMFSHPVSGITHTLTVQEIEQQTVPQNSFGSDRWIYPTHYIAMSYTLTPEPMENISVFDCDEGDRPIEVTPDDHSFRPVGSSSCFVVGVIGGADGPTAIFTTIKLAPHLLGPIAIAAYSYMALVPVIIPLVVRIWCTKKELSINMKEQEKKYPSKTEIKNLRVLKILFPIVVTTIVALFVPSAVPLIGMLMFGNLVKEIGSNTSRLFDAASNSIMNAATIFLGISVGATMTTDAFLNWTTIGIVIGGFLAFALSISGGILFVKVFNLFTKKKINPLIGATGLSAVPMASRVANEIALKYDPKNHVLQYCMASNISGVIGSAVAAGVLISFLG